MARDTPAEGQDGSRSVDIDTAKLPPGEPGTPGDGSAAMAGLIGRPRLRAGYRRMLRIVGARRPADRAR
jgi:hypothetical protein